jgi:hypothetical protein
MRTAKIVMIGTVLTVLAQPCIGQSATKPYSNAEIDAKVNTVRMLLTERTYSKEDIDTKFNAIVTDFADRLQALARQQETALAGSNAKLDTALAEATLRLDKKIDTATEFLTALIKDVDGKIPTIPWWVNLIVAAFLGFISAALIAAYNNSQNAKQRQLDYNQRQDERRIDAAKQVVDNWLSRRNTTLAAVNYYLDNPDMLFLDKQQGTLDANHVNAVTECGDWYDSISERWLGEELDPSTMDKMKLRDMLILFWKRLEAAAKKEPAVGLDKYKVQWTHLAELVNS